MPVIGHKAIAKKWHRKALAGLGQHPLESSIIAVLGEQGRPVRAIKGMIDVAAQVDTQSPSNGEETILAHRPSQGKKVPDTFVFF